MRLFHVSEEGNIQVFEPREPLRTDWIKYKISVGNKQRQTC